MDYHCRINRYGFSSVISHHALFSYNSKKKSVYNIKDKKLLNSRYKSREDNNKWFAEHEVHPCLRFIKLLDDEYYPRKRILFDCILMPAMHCGTSEYQKSVFEAFNRLYGDKYDIYLYVHREVDEYHKLSTKYDNIVYPDNISGVFHLGFAPNQLMHIEHQVKMNMHCLKNVQTMFDIMMVRIDEHNGIDVDDDVKFGIKLCDGIIFISNYTKNDFLACYSNESVIKDKIFKVVYLATALGVAKNEHNIPFDDYFLIVGNSYKHKAIKEAIDAVSSSQHNFIVVGYGDNDYIKPNIYSYKSGHLDDDFLSYLYANCKAVIFPSLYEGFGLPLVIGFKCGKRVIINNNALNNELLEHFNKFKEYFLLFDKFEQIGEIIENTDFSVELKKVEYNDSWDRVAAELESFFCDILEEDVNVDTLVERWQLFNLLNMKIDKAEQEITSQRSEISYLRKPYESRSLSRLLYFAIRVYVKNRHQRLFAFLKRVVKKK